MGRREREDPIPPVSSSGVALGKRPRLTVTSDVRTAVDWLRKAKPPVPCLLSFGPEGQVVVSSSESSLARDRERFFDAVRKNPGLASTAEGQRLARFFAATWIGSIQTQFQLTLPEALTASWLLDARNVSIVGLTDTLEIWRPQAWVSDAAGTSAVYESLLESILDLSDE